MTTEITIQTKQTEWSKFAVAVHNTEQRLQLSCSKLVQEIATLPPTIEDLPAAEALIKRVKADLSEQVELRMTITRKFDAVSDRLRLNEKSVQAAIPAFDTAILEIKKKERTEKEKVAARNAEIARFRESFSLHISNLHAQFESAVNSKVIKCFEHCLTENVAPDAIPMDKMQASLAEPMFVTEPPASSGKVYLNDDEVFEIWKEIKEKQSLSPASYITSFHNALAEKFNFYSVALKNKEAALELAKKEAADNEAKIQKERSDAAVSAKLETISVASDAAPVSTGKKIKTVYKLEMEDNENNALIVLTAFASNWGLCKGEIRVKSMFALSIGQMGAALESVKNKDEKFEVSGVKWVKVDKL